MEWQGMIPSNYLLLFVVPPVLFLFHFPVFGTRLLDSVLPPLALVVLDIPPGFPVLLARLVYMEYSRIYFGNRSYHS